MNAVAEYIWKAYRAAGMTEAGAAAMLGSIEEESAFIVNNVEDRMHSVLGWTDEQYTAAVDSGSYTRFAQDAYGYGIHQWTLRYRKDKMLSRAKALGKSIGDLSFQCSFAIYELSGEGEYAALWSLLRSSTDVDMLSDRVTDIYERPANATQQKLRRRVSSRKWLKALSGTEVTAAEGSEYWPPRTIDVGMGGPDVAVWQALMMARGIECPLTGEFDAATKEATLSYQERAMLTKDGIPGPKSWAAALSMEKGGV